ncbi:MAG: ATP-binding protein [Planctomycetota bacterium]|nr:ATP-binding protein [Planctomycetota bacterium]
MITFATASRPCRVLLVESDPADVRMLKRALSDVSNSHYHVQHVSHLPEALNGLSRRTADVAIVGLSLLDSTSKESFEALSVMATSVPIVVVTDWEDELLAIELLQHGVQDYLLKQEIEPKLLARSLQFAIERNRATALELLNGQLALVQSSLTKAVEQLERTNEDLAQFSYFASHDLQEPVRKVNYFAEQLYNNIGDALNEDARKDFRFIVDAASRMQNLIQSLLALSKAENMNLEWGLVDLNTCVDDSIDCLAAQIKQSNAVISRDSLPVVTGNSTLLCQLYQNLLSNALKFTAGSAPMIQVTAELIGDDWLLGVCDNGIGIQPEFTQSVFAPFQRLNSRDKYDGSGIGLTICRKVIDRHNGQIWVESTPGGGTHFKFLLKAVARSELESNQRLSIPSICDEFCLTTR